MVVPPPTLDSGSPPPLPPCCAGARVYSFLFTGFGSAALMGPILGSYLLRKGGFELLYTTLGLLSLVSTALAAATF